MPIPVIPQGRPAEDADREAAPYCSARSINRPLRSGSLLPISRFRAASSVVPTRQPTRQLILNDDFPRHIIRVRLEPRGPMLTAPVELPLVVLDVRREPEVFAELHGSLLCRQQPSPLGPIRQDGAHRRLISAAASSAAPRTASRQDQPEPISNGPRPAAPEPAKGPASGAGPNPSCGLTRPGPPQAADRAQERARLGRAAISAARSPTRSSTARHPWGTAASRISPLVRFRA